MSDLPARMITRATRTVGGAMPMVRSRYETSHAAPTAFEALSEQVVVESQAGRREGPGERQTTSIPARIPAGEGMASPRTREDIEFGPVVGGAEAPRGLEGVVEEQITADGPSEVPVAARVIPTAFATAEPEPMADGKDGGEPARPRQARARSEEPLAVSSPPTAEGTHSLTEVTVLFDGRNPETAIGARSSAAPAGRWPGEDSPRSRRPFETPAAEPTVEGTHSLTEETVLSDDRDPETAIGARSSAAPAGRWPGEDSSRSRRAFETRAAEPMQAVEVHVSIGHIEVRQAAPPAPPRLRPAAPPHVPLEEYLKRRNGDAR